MVAYLQIFVGFYSKMAVTINFIVTAILIIITIQTVTAFSTRSINGK